MKLANYFYYCNTYFLAYVWHKLLIAMLVCISITMAPAIAFSSPPMSGVAVSPTPTILFFSALFFLVVGSGLLLFFRKRHYYNNQHYRQQALHDIPSFILVGYYSYHIKTETEILSNGLKSYLNLPADSCQFEHFKSCFSEECYQRLKNLYENGAYLLDSNTSSAIISFSLENSDQKKWLECTLEVSSSADKDDETATIWFRDVSTHIQSQQWITEKNEQLNGQLQHMGRLLDSISFPIWSRNQSLSIEYGNAAYRALVNCKEDSIILPAIAGLEGHMLTLAQSSQTSKEQQQVNKHIIVEGKRRLFQLSESPIVNEDGVVGVGYDITRQEEIEKELQFYISAQSALLESSSSAMAIYGADTNLKFFNQAFMKLWELDEIWLANQPTYSLVLDVLREKRKLPEQINFLNFKQGHLKLFTDITEPHNEFFHLPDGRSIRMIAIPHALGGVLFAYEDMTDKLALESSYNMLAAVQKATLDNLHEGIAVIGQDGRLKLYNPVYAQMWHHDIEILKTKPHFSDLVETAKYLYKYDGSWDVVKRHVLDMLSNRVALSERIERRDGTVINRLCVPLPDGATLMSYLDITDSIRFERSLIERNKMLQEVDHIKTEFLANISYELRTPLTSIMGLSEALEKQYFGELNLRQKEYVEGIYSSSQQLLSIINDILDLTSIEAGNMELDTESLNIYTVLSSVSSLIKERVKEAGILFSVDCDKAIGTIMADERRIKQAVLKLVTNAIEFTPAGGSIVLGARETKDNNIIIWVNDTGEGIATDDQQVIFNKFYRTEAARIRGKGGTGLGLSVVKSFIELHQGKIELESSLGIGTKVSCILPKTTIDTTIDKEEDVVVCAS